MPIQPMGVNSYSQIPDEEDVTPIDGSIAKKAQRSFKLVAFIVFLFLVVIVALVGLWEYDLAVRGVEVYQTSMSSSEGLLRIGTADFNKMDAKVRKVDFGNTRCKSTACTNMPSNTAKLVVDSKKPFQEILGFGGAFTEAVAHNFYQLPSEVQEKIIQMYFGEDGIGYSIGRIHINSCDFSLKSYSFDDIAGDYKLEYFDKEVTHDNAYIIPLILSAAAASKNPLKILASPWSPPAWMKVPVDGVQSMTGSAWPNGLLADSRTQETWARYISKFITAYKEKGIGIWALTPQNEPEFAAPWEGCLYNASFESSFINNHLGPVVKSEHPDIKILAFDHNKDHLLDWTKTIIGNDNGYVDGMAFHWYSNGERIEDGTNGYDAVNASHHYAPDKIMLATEGCSCPGVQLNDWLRAERLGHDVMFDINNYAQGWIDWNLLVDHEGGPNHLGNVCDAAMICNKDYTEVHVQPSFYYMAHFSKFAPPGSKRIKSTIVGDYQYKGSDSNVQAGLQVGMYSCEKSVRQMWKIDSKNGVIGFYHYMKDAKSKDPDLCVAAGTESVAHIRLVDCSYKKAQLLRVFMNEVGQLVDATTGMCVGLNGDVREPGALLDLFPCIGKDSKHSNDHQIFSVDKKTGEIKSKVMDMCMTANWPLLNSVAFTTLQMKTVVVVMNEADIPATVVLSDGTKKGDFGFAIDARSIQTLIY